MPEFFSYQKEIVGEMRSILVNQSPIILCNSSPPAATLKRLELPLHTPHGFGERAGSLFSTPHPKQAVPLRSICSAAQGGNLPSSTLGKQIVPQFTQFSVSGV